MSRRTGVLLKLLVSGALLLGVVKLAGSRGMWPELMRSLANVGWGWLGLATFFHALSIVIGVQRWEGLLRAEGLAVRTLWVVRTYLVGRFVGAYAPGTVGMDLYRTLAVARVTGDRGRAAAVIFLEKLLGLCGLAALGVILVPMGADVFAHGAVLPALFAVALAATGTIYAMTRKGMIARITAKVPAAFRRRVETLLRTLRVGGVSRAGFLRGVAASTAAHLAVSCVFVCTARAVGITVAASDLLVLGGAVVVGQLLPVSISGFGVREGLAVAFLARFGVSHADALLAALLGYVTGQAPAVLGGIAALLREPHAHETEDEMPTFARILSAAGSISAVGNITAPGIPAP